MHFFLENLKDKGFSSVVGLPIDNITIGTDVIDYFFVLDWTPANEVFLMDNMKMAPIFKKTRDLKKIHI